MQPAAHQPVSLSMVPGLAGGVRLHSHSAVRGAVKRDEASETGAAEEVLGTTYPQSELREAREIGEARGPLRGGTAHWTRLDAKWPHPPRRVSLNHVIHRPERSPDEGEEDR